MREHLEGLCSRACALDILPKRSLRWLVGVGRRHVLALYLKRISVLGGKRQAPPSDAWGEPTTGLYVVYAPKWLMIILLMWQRQVPYNEEHHLATMARCAYGSSAGTACGVGAGRMGRGHAWPRGHAGGTLRHGEWGNIRGHEGEGPFVSTMLSHLMPDCHDRHRVPRSARRKPFPHSTFRTLRIT